MVTLVKETGKQIVAMTVAIGMSATALSGCGGRRSYLLDQDSPTNGQGSQSGSFEQSQTVSVNSGPVVPPSTPISQPGGYNSPAGPSPSMPHASAQPPSPQPPSPTQPTCTTPTPKPLLSELELYDGIKKMVNFGPRHTGSSAHKNYLNFLESEMRRMGFQNIRRDTVNITGHNFMSANDAPKSGPTDHLYGILPGASSRLILLGVHSDGQNAIEENGTVTLLKIAEALSKLPQANRKHSVLLAYVTAHMAKANSAEGDGWAKLHPDLIKQTDFIFSPEHLGVSNSSLSIGVTTSSLRTELSKLAGFLKLDDLRFGDVSLGTGLSFKMATTGIPVINSMDLPFDLTKTNTSVSRIDSKKFFEQSNFFWEAYKLVDGTVTEVASSCSKPPSSGQGSSNPPSTGVPVYPNPAIATDSALLANEIVYYPTPLQSGTPALMWSNGRGGTPSKVDDLLRKYTAAGYVVFASKEKWDDQPEDVSKRIDAVVTEVKRQGSKLYQKVNLNRIGIVGFSMGGGQVVAAAGHNGDSRIKAVVGLSPWPGYTSTSFGFNKPMYGPPLLILVGTDDVDHNYTRFLGKQGFDANAEEIFTNWKDSEAFLAISSKYETAGSDSAGKAYNPNYVEPTLQWFNWTLRGVANSRGYFTGSSCVPCKNPVYKIRKNF